jgi:hypothetical protein
MRIQGRREDVEDATTSGNLSRRSSYGTSRPLTSPKEADTTPVVTAASAHCHHHHYLVCHAISVPVERVRDRDTGMSFWIRMKTPHEDKEEK